MGRFGDLLSGVAKNEGPNPAKEPRRIEQPVRRSKFSTLLAPSEEAQRRVAGDVLGLPIIGDVISGSLGNIALGLDGLVNMTVGPEAFDADADINGLTRQFITSAERFREASDAFATGREGIITDVAQGLGSMVTFPVAPMALFQEAFEQMVSQGVDEKTAAKAAFIPAVTNTALEFVGLGKVRKGFRAIGNFRNEGFRKTQQFIAPILASAQTEGLTEGAQQLTNNIVAAAYDPETDNFNVKTAQKIVKDVAHSAFIGALVGGAATSMGAFRTQREMAENGDFATEEGAATAVEMETALEQALEEATTGRVDATTGTVIEPGNPLDPAVQAEGVDPELYLSHDEELGSPAGHTDFVQNTFSAVIGSDVGASDQGGFVEQTIDRWSKPLIQVVQELPGATGQRLGRLGQEAIDDTKSIIGDVQEDVAEIQRLINSGFKVRDFVRNPVKAVRGALKKRATFRELHSFVREGAGGETVFRRAMESDVFFEELSPEAQEIVSKTRALTLKMGQEAQLRGVEIEVSGSQRQTVEIAPGVYTTTGISEKRRIPFTPEPEGRRLARTWSPAQWQIIQAGPGTPGWNTLVRVLSDHPMNQNMGEDVVLLRLQALHNDALQRKAPFEVAREFPYWPSSIWVDGRRIDLLNDDPFNAAQQMVYHQALRLGFISRFGQDSSEVQAALDSVLQQDGKNGVRKAENLVKALQGIPLDNPSFNFQPGTQAYEVYRWVRALSGMQRSGLLTESAIPNLSETIFTVPATAGHRRYLVGAAELAKATFQKRVLGRELVFDPAHEINKFGARTIDVLNWNWEPQRAAESITRLGRNILVFGGQKVNEMNEAINAYAGVKMAADLRDGKGTVADGMRLEFMRFTPEQVESLLAGAANEDLLQTVAQRVTETGQGTTSLPAERSRLANSRIYNQFIAFDSYAQKTFNRTLRLHAQLADAARVARADPSPANLKRLGIATSQMGSWLGGAAAAGYMSVFIRAFVRNGVVGAVAAAGDFEDDLSGSFVEAMKYTLLSGAAQIVEESVRNVMAGKSSAVDIGNVIMPVRGFFEVYNFATGNGPYNELGAGDAFEQFAARNVVVTRSTMAWAGIIGLGGRDAEMEVAINQFYKWQRKNIGNTFVNQTGPEDHNNTAREIAVFRTSMKAAVSAMRFNKGDDVVVKHLQAAIGSGGGEARASLKGRRLLQRIPTRFRAQFFEEFDARHLQKLQQYDQMVDSWADMVK